MGPFSPADLRPELRTALSGLAPGQISPVGRLGGEFFLLALISPSETEWSTENAAATEALKARRYADAAKSFSKAVALAEKFGADDDRLADSLNGLAETYNLQENFAGTASVYKRILSIRWSPDSNKGNPAVAALLDRFSDLLALAYFRGNQFEQALKNYRTALNETPASEALYLAMTSRLVKAELTAEAENVMLLAQSKFPESRRLRYKAAEMYRDSGKMQKALEVFQAASQMKAPASMPPDLASAQLSFIYQRIGGINTDLTQFDAAIAAYKKAIEISPKNADARMALGDVYLRRGQRAEALAEYSALVSAYPDKASPHSHFADAKLQMGDFAEAAAAADKAVKIDARERKAHYVKGLALTRMGRAQEGQQELEEYSRQEKEAQAQIDEERGVIVSNRGSADLVLRGQTEEAVASFKKSIQNHPAATAIRFNFGIALGLMGRHGDAVAVLKDLIAGSTGEDFLIDKALAREYGALKDAKMSQKFDALYIRNMDTALEEELH